MAATKGLSDHLFMAACEWVLMFWMFIEAALAYSLTKFATSCRLQIPCLLCSRLDHFFGNEEPGSYSYLHLFCNKHQTDISYLIYCNLHNILVDAREMCEDCFNLVTLQTQSNLECYRFVVGQNGKESKRFQRSYLNKNFVSDPCSCCKSQWKEKSTGQHPIHVIGSRVSKETTKPPFPRVARHGRSKRIKNKVKHRHRNALSPVGQYSEVKFTSDSDFEFLFSDDDGGGGFEVVGISERNLKNNTKGENRYNILGRHSYSTPDLMSAFLEAQLNESSRTSTRTRTRSASLTPKCLINHNLAELNRKTEEFDPLKIGKDKKPLSSMNRKTDGDQKRNKIFSRNSSSASDLNSALFLEMHNNKRLSQRSASLTPNISSGYSLGEHNWSKNAPPKPKKNKKSTFNNIRSGLSTSYLDKFNGYGYSDDSVILHNTGNHHNRNKIPRRHSYSVFQLGGKVLLNMPIDESQNCSLAHDLEEYKKSKSHLPELGFHETVQFPLQKGGKDYEPLEYGSLDDSVVTCKWGIWYQNNIPRRHSYSFFDPGCEILLHMPFNESLTTRSASFATSSSIGYGLGEPKNSKFEIRPNSSVNFVQFPNRKAKRDKKSFPSLNRTNGYESLDDSVVSFNTGIHNANKNPRRHSYSAFELGCALLLNMQPVNESLTNRSTFVTPNGYINHGLGEEKKSGFQTRPNSSHSTVFLDKNNGFGSLDDSVVTRNTGTHNHNYNHNQNKIPRRHSYSVLQLGGDILLNMPIDESLTSHSLYLSPNDSIGQSSGDPQKSKFQKVEVDKKSLPPTGSVKKFGSSHDVRSDLSIDKTKWHGSFDDYLISRSTSSQSQGQNNISRRHSHSAFDLGRALLVEINLDNSLKNFQAPNGSNRHHSGKHYWAHQKAKRNKNPLPPPGPMNGPGSSSDLFTVSLDNKTHGVRSLDDSFFSHQTGIHNQNNNNNPRRHSYSAFELGCALLLNMHPDASLTRRSVSVTPKIQKVKESQHIKSKKDELSLASVNTIRSDFSNTSLNKSTSLTPDCSIGLGLGELTLLKFQTGSTSLQKRKKGDRRSKAKNSKKPLPSANNVKVTNSSSVPLDNSDKYESFDDSVFANNTGSRNRYKMFSRNSQSASDLRSVLLLEMNHDHRLRNRSKSLTPNSSSHSPDSVQFAVRRPEQNDSAEVEKDKKQLPAINPTKEMDSKSTIRTDLCANCFDKIDLRSLDGSSVSEFDGDGGLEKVKRQAEDDVRCMRLLQSELEAERNAATVAANHAMNMITRLQQEKASLQMEALQYLRMMEEQAEYDMEALQKANELVEEKENEIQDLLDELEQYKSKYGDESMNNIKCFDDEKSYILESLSTLEKKINQLSNGVYDKSKENENYVDFATLEHEIIDMKEKMEALQADVDLIKHACNTLHGNEGLEFIQEIAHQLQDLRKNMFDRRLISNS